MTFDQYFLDELRTAKAHGLRLSQKEKDQIVQDWLRHEKRLKDRTWEAKKAEAEDAWAVRRGVAIPGSEVHENHSTMTG